MMKTPIFDFIKGYAESGTARFHMPGHKGRAGLEADITEIKGADELYGADGIIAESENNAAALFGSAHTYYSTEGSTLAIKAMLTLAAFEAPAGERPLFVAARNSHKAFLYALAMLDADVEWIYPKDCHICKCEVSPEAAKKAIEGAKRKPDGFYITSPDYLGNIADIKGIAEVCDEYGVPLLVDNAHGAYLAFLEDNTHPMALGASMCADSAHKTLPVLTGGAYLHIAKKADRFCFGARSAMAMYASTSPSYLILRSLDLCNKELCEGYAKSLAECIGRVAELKARLEKKGILTEGNDPLKIVVNSAAAGYDGRELGQYLRERLIEPEFCDSDYTVLMITPSNSKEDMDRLSSALMELELLTPLKREGGRISARKRIMSVREAVFAPCETVRAQDAEGRICASPTVSCPPAVPVAVSGELIDVECIKSLLRYGIDSISVVKNK